MGRSKANNSLKSSRALKPTKRFPGDIMEGVSCLGLYAAYLSGRILFYFITIIYSLILQLIWRRRRESRKTTLFSWALLALFTITILL